MKKLLTTIALLSTLTLASEHPIELGIGYAPGDNSGDMLTAYASIEVLGGIASRFEYSKNINDGELFSTEDLSRYAIFATYNLALTPNMSLTPKIGIVKNDSEVKIGDVLSAVSSSSTELTYGLELNYSYNESLSFYVGYTDYGNDFDFDKTYVDSDYLDSANFTVGVKVGL
ncbi:MAG: hypothetical protein Q9M36_14225 [Sulfurovum sp.]|nr:hypothetical protein [Sulfurovum sp.]